MARFPAPSALLALALLSACATSVREERTQVLQLVRTGRFEEARERAHAILADHPDDPVAQRDARDAEVAVLLAEGIQRVYAQQPLTALRWFQEARALSPDNEMARTWSRKTRVQLAEDALDRGMGETGIDALQARADAFQLALAYLPEDERGLRGLAIRCKAEIGLVLAQLFSDYLSGGNFSAYQDGVRDLEDYVRMAYPELDRLGGNDPISTISAPLTSPGGVVAAAEDGKERALTIERRAALSASFEASGYLAAAWMENSLVLRDAPDRVAARERRQRLLAGLADGWRSSLVPVDTPAAEPAARVGAMPPVDPATPPVATADPGPESAPAREPEPTPTASDPEGPSASPEPEALEPVDPRATVTTPEVSDPAVAATEEEVRPAPPPATVPAEGGPAPKAEEPTVGPGLPVPLEALPPLGTDADPLAAERRALYDERYAVARRLEVDGDLRRAVEAYDTILAGATGFRDAQARRDTLQEFILQAQELYLAAEEAETADEAEAHLRAIAAFWPSYRDVARRLGLEEPPDPDAPPVDRAADESADAAGDAAGDDAGDDDGAEDPPR